MKIGYTAVAMAFVLLFAAWAVPAYADDEEPSVIFDLNGGTINGNGTFAMTAEELSDGLPGVTGAVMPTGADEFVVWSATPGNYENLYNPGDGAPDVPRLYAVWGTKLSSSGNITIPGSGCYVIENFSGMSVDINSTNVNGALVVLRNVNYTYMSASRNVTFIVQGTNVENNFHGWDNFRLEFSSASTGRIFFNSPLYSQGPIILRGDITVNGIIDGGSIDIDGNVDTKTSIYSKGSIVLRGNVTSTGKIDGGSIDIDGTVETGDIIYSDGPVAVKGDVSANGQIMGSSVALEGTVSAGSVYTKGGISIDGHVTVVGNIDGASIDVKGTLIADTLNTNNLIVNDSAVVKIGDSEYNPPGREYIKFEISNGFDTENVTDIVVKFKITDKTQNYRNMSILLPGFSNKIFLGSDISIPKEDERYNMDVYFMKDGTKWHSVGNVTYKPADSENNIGYYTCILGEPSEATDPDDEQNLSFISKPPSVAAGLYVYVLKGTHVKLISTGTELNVSIIGNNTVTVSIPESSEIYGYWGSLDDMTPDDNTENEYTIMNDGFGSCGTFTIFVNSGTQTVPVCIVTVPGIEFDTVPWPSFA